MSVIKVATTPAVEVLPFHRDVYKIATACVRATESAAVKMQALVTSRYGDKSPEFGAFRKDMKALDAIAKDKGLSDGQYLKRAYCAAIKALYKELPVSQEPAAILKRAQREADLKLVKDTLAKAKAAQTMQAVSNPVGAPAGQTQERTPSEPEKLESVVARLGVFETLYACLRILEAEPATAAQVIHMRKMADKAKDESFKAEQAARLAAIKPADTINA